MTFPLACHKRSTHNWGQKSSETLTRFFVLFSLSWVLKWNNWKVKKFENWRPFVAKKLLKCMKCTYEIFLFKNLMKYYICQNLLQSKRGKFCWFGFPVQCWQNVINFDLLTISNTFTPSPKRTERECFIFLVNQPKAFSNWQLPTLPENRFRNHANGSGVVPESYKWFRKWRA